MHRELNACIAHTAPPWHHKKVQFRPFYNRSYAPRDPLLPGPDSVALPWVRCYRDKTVLQASLRPLLRSITFMARRHRACNVILTGLHALSMHRLGLLTL
jgi:hypothetical protein